MTTTLSEALLPLIEHLMEFERAGRQVAAALALIRVRERYAELGPDDVAHDERTWTEFARRHIPLPPGRVSELIGRMAHRGGLLRCRKCGTGSLCPCVCGVPYDVEYRWAKPHESAIERATAALAADPARSNRAIAKEIGVGEQSVRRARRQMQNAGG